MQIIKYTFLQWSSMQLEDFLVHFLKTLFPLYFSYFGLLWKMCELQRITRICKIKVIYCYFNALKIVYFSVCEVSVTTAENKYILFFFKFKHKNWKRNEVVCILKNLEDTFWIQKSAFILILWCQLSISFL